MPSSKPIKSRLFNITAYGVMILIANGCQNSNNNPQSSHISNSARQQSSDIGKVRNAILFIGDGMGISTITAGRIFDGQSQGKTGEEHSLAFENFENVALIKTYNYDAQVPDSAGTATAIMSGYKARIGTINVPPDNLFAGCGQIAAPPTLAKRAAKTGRSVGIISTARITHATPAAMYSHARDRGWEADKDISEDGQVKGCKSIAAQLVDPASQVNLALGGGAKEFSKAQFDAWSEQGDDYVVIRTGTELTALNPKSAQNVFGAFSRSHMSFEADRAETDEPSLADLTSFAIDNLSARKKGYILMVEAGRIDHAHHGSNAYRALRDVQALNEAVKTALDKTGDDTLIMVTADHSHVFTMSGYPVRGNPILGLVSGIDSTTGRLGEGYMLAKDGKPYTTLGYQNGSNIRLPDSPALTDNAVQAPDYRQQVAVPTSSETHGGEDVALFATGPGADRVRGVMDQPEIYEVISHALDFE